MPTYCNATNAKPLQNKPTPNQQEIDKYYNLSKNQN